MAKANWDQLLLPNPGREMVVACRLGSTRYERLWELQRELQTRLVEAKKRAEPEYLPHVLLLLEHNAVFTLGKSGSESNLVWDAAQREVEGVEFHRIDRGGDVTFHGPGQLVGYPILDLDRFYTDIHRYLRELEESVIRTLADAGLAAGRSDGRTGVWIGPDKRGPERKICAMGVRCSRWVTMHGFALNVHPRLGFYEGIIPCGIGDRGVTSISKEIGPEAGAVSMEQVMDGVESGFGATFDCDVHRLEGTDAWDFLSAFLGRVLDTDTFLVKDA